MSQSETTAHQASAAAVALPSSLVLVAPMPRRPIALVARRHHHHHPRSRTSRIGSAAKTTTDEPKDSAERVSSPSSMSRTIGHPYSRVKTPSNAATGGPLGLGITPVSPPPTRSRAASREGMVSRSVSRLSSREGAVVAMETISDAAAAVKAEEGQDETMSASSVASAAPMDVERTPTKPKQPKSIENDQEPRSTPTLGAASPRSAEALTLSPTSPSQQRSAAAASAEAQLAFPSPPTETERGGAEEAAVASITPSLSESLSRSPSASPSPCPSPASPLGTGLDLHTKDAVEVKGSDEGRKMGLGLPPLPTSPIPRRMTRNPFERYLTEVGVGSGLNERLRLAMARAGVVEGLEGMVGDGDEEMVEDGVRMEVEE